MVEAKANGICKPSAEKMGPLQRENLSRYQASLHYVVGSIRSRVGTSIKHIGAENRVFIGEVVIDTTRDEVLVHNLLSGECVGRNVAIALWGSVGRMKKGQVSGSSKIY